ncbi:CRISPR-associated protein, Csm1 family [Methanocaldococcus vulcanius M7]|uniref:CRISPR system single-strand-specific deoxyribonuclease Cas10/Csm1 (subtype III-A) n=1 Tax=Methanocaldococcus vulcanius (strain ATCC 700851 / DSM 12094 / M7) TaxID=579137 RepID=C9RHF3_METVM|nr:type III-A CRISPR-associated protein Cas10/Csm1 [Methanocaldococcus vulcanius]ACX73005.1 CRISPR-associated protein, Csm1 family [Methanocaldococcus vulcanius M7]
MGNCDEYTALKIGALLHDIGKFVQRVDNQEIKSLKDKSKDKYGNIKHQSIGAVFIEKYYKNLGINEEIKNLIIEFVKNHHNSNIKTGLIGIIRLADWLSSAEREEIEEFKSEAGSKKEDQRLLSIFELIRLEEEDRKIIDKKLSEIYNNGGKYGLQPLAINSHTIFPYKSPNPSYEQLYEAFINELTNNKIDNFKKLYQLVQKYFWCVPSATNWKKYGGYLPDISLYDHLKTTCAIACCLYQIYKGNVESDAVLTDEMLKELLKRLPLDKNGLYDPELNKSWEKYTLFSLIHGDISGIQKFIFKISSKHAAKSLKGRSFYLDFLTEIFAKWICKELDLPITNILFYGGGHFYILSYKITEEKIEEFEKKINDLLYGMFNTDLYLTIAKVDIKPSEFLSQATSNFSYKWKEVADETITKKLKRFGYKIHEIFEVYNEGIDEKCKICGREITDTEYYLPYQDEKIKICKYCDSFVKLTNFLKECQKSKEIDFSKFKKKSIKSIEIPDLIKISDIPAISSIIKGINEKGRKIEGLGITFGDGDYFLTKYNLPKNVIDKEDNKIKEEGALEIPYKIWSIAFPIKDGEIIDFDELAEKSSGTKKIAILKMDVDNLGSIFTEGLGDRASISRLSTLSSMLTLFFTGYIPHLINKKYSEDIYLVYSGGDDTLIVGSWDKIWELAKEIRKEFKKFVCYNPEITLSAGVMIINPKFEFRKAADMAEKELEAGKHNIIYEKEDEEEKMDKNAITIFECPMNWDLEVFYDRDLWEKMKLLKNIGVLPEIYDKVLLSNEEMALNFNEDNLEKEFDRAIKKVGRKRLLHITQIVADRLGKIVKKEGENVVLNIPYYWRTLYYLRRNYSDSEEYVAFLKKYLKNKVLTFIKDDNKNLKIEFNDLKVSAKIVELKNRQER